MPTELAPTDRTTFKRAPDRGSYDRDLAYSILDEGMVAHVGIEVDGQPYVIPMAYGRDGDRLLLHGSVASRLMRALAGGHPVCVTVTLIDAMVLARSTFHHSMNYRSVVVLGQVRRIEDAAEADAALAILVDHLVPGRSAEARSPNTAELRQTAVLELPIVEASVKVRAGGPIDDPDDLDLPVWSGVLPLGIAVGAPMAEDDAAHLPVPESVRGWRRGQSPAAADVAGG